MLDVLFCMMWVRSVGWYVYLFWYVGFIFGFLDFWFFGMIGERFGLVWDMRMMRWKEVCVFMNNLSWYFYYEENFFFIVLCFWVWSYFWFMLFIMNFLILRVDGKMFLKIFWFMRFSFYVKKCCIYNLIYFFEL